MRAANSGAVCARGEGDADLAELVAAWPTLPAEVRAEIIRLVRDGKKG